MLRTVEAAGGAAAGGAPWRILLKEQEQFVQVGRVRRGGPAADCGTRGGFAPGGPAGERDKAFLHTGLVRQAGSMSCIRFAGPSWLNRLGMAASGACADGASPSDRRPCPHLRASVQHQCN